MMVFGCDGYRRPRRYKGLLLTRTVFFIFLPRAPTQLLRSPADAAPTPRTAKTTSNGSMRGLRHERLLGRR